jgi:hypothetical protein
MAVPSPLPHADRLTNDVPSMARDLPWILRAALRDARPVMFSAL